LGEQSDLDFQAVVQQLAQQRAVVVQQVERMVVARMVVLGVVQHSPELQSPAKTRVETSLRVSEAHRRAKKKKRYAVVLQ